jgi:hypothetical protein
MKLSILALLGLAQAVDPKNCETNKDCLVEGDKAQLLTCGVRKGETQGKCVPCEQCWDGVNEPVLDNNGVQVTEKNEDG